ncbi:MAG: hypothetical protein NZU63_06175 [Gemmataceae bacterium]|nr:hypothetical protein [Gemmataceae bacterium]MDW8242575.1 hypothetical protein [Thermogemmata sp.]
MLIQITCPGCQAHYLMTREEAGKTVRCRRCHTELDVPGVAPSTTPGKVRFTLDQLLRRRGLKHKTASQSDSEESLGTTTKLRPPSLPSQAVQGRLRPRTKDSTSARYTTRSDKDQAKASERTRKLVTLVSGAGLFAIAVLVTAALLANSSRKNTAGDYVSNNSAASINSAAAPPSSSQSDTPSLLKQAQPPAGTDFSPPRTPTLPESNDAHHPRRPGSFIAPDRAGGNGTSTWPLPPIFYPMGKRKALLEPFYAAVFDPSRGEFLACLPRLETKGARLQGTLVRYRSVDHFVPLGRYKLPHLAVRAVIDHRQGLLFALAARAESAAAISQLAQQNLEHATACGDIVVYDLKPIYDNQVEDSKELTPQTVIPFYAPQAYVRSLALSEDGSQLYVLTTWVSSGRPSRSTITVVDTLTRKPIRSRDLPEPAGELVLSPDGQYLVITERTANGGAVRLLKSSDLTSINSALIKGTPIDVTMTRAGQIAVTTLISVRNNHPASGFVGPDVPQGIDPSGLGIIGGPPGLIPPHGYGAWNGGLPTGGNFAGAPGQGMTGVNTLAGRQFVAHQFEIKALLVSDRGVEELPLNSPVRAANNGYLRFSPDGKWLLAASYREPGYDLYEVIDLTSPTNVRHRLALRSADNQLLGGHFLLSPDGRHVVFHNGVVLDTTETSSYTPATSGSDTRGTGETSPSSSSYFIPMGGAGRAFPGSLSSPPSSFSEGISTPLGNMPPTGPLLPGIERLPNGGMSSSLPLPTTPVGITYTPESPFIPAPPAMTVRPVPFFPGPATVALPPPVPPAVMPMFIPPRPVFIPPVPMVPPVPPSYAMAAMRMPPMVAFYRPPSPPITSFCRPVITCRPCVSFSCGTSCCSPCTTYRIRRIR